MKSIGKTIFTVLLIVLVWGQAMRLANAAESEVASQIDFDKNVWPIFESRCVECHNAERAEGDLRFDAGRAGLEQGGLAGQGILGSSSSESELIRRITSEKIGYRMPKKGPPLTKTEVGTLADWIDAGAAWGTGGSSVTPVRSIQSDDRDTVDVLADGLFWFQQEMERQSFRRMVYLAGIALLALGGLWFLLRRSQSQRPLVSRLKTVTIFALVFLTLATWIHYDGRYKETLAQKQAVETKLFSYTGPAAAHSLSPPYPMHPPRLGGIYYRGNDERDPRLFNGGFYRTAQLEIWLTDSDRKRLKWGDVVEGEVYIEFLIARAAGTTGELFSDQVMSVVGLTDDVRIAGTGSDVRTIVEDVVGMKTVVAGQQWRSEYRLKQLDSAAGGDKRVAGKLFLVQNTARAKAHYGIEFEILLDDENRILESSQLWMGSLYNLNGRVFVP